MWRLSSYWLDINWSVSWWEWALESEETWTVRLTFLPVGLWWGQREQYAWSTWSSVLCCVSTPKTVRVLILSFSRYLFGLAKMPMKLRKQNHWSLVSQIPWMITAINLVWFLPRAWLFFPPHLPRAVDPFKTKEFHDGQEKMFCYLI
jgi:hypothetical protein